MQRDILIIDLDILCMDKVICKVPTTVNKLVQIELNINRLVSLANELNLKIVILTTNTSLIYNNKILMFKLLMNNKVKGIKNIDIFNSLKNKLENYIVSIHYDEPEKVIINNIKDVAIGKVIVLGDDILKTSCNVHNGSHFIKISDYITTDVSNEVYRIIKNIPK